MNKNNYINFDIGMRIRELRLKNGLSQEELAMRSNITTTYLGLVERNVKNPTVKVIEQICHSLGVSLGAFFTDDMIPYEVPLDDISLQITVQLANRTENEKKVILQLVKELIRFRDLPDANK